MQLKISIRKLGALFGTLVCRVCMYICIWTVTRSAFEFHCLSVLLALSVKVMKVLTFLYHYILNSEVWSQDH